MASTALVVGSGAIGLRTALELLRKNVKVALKAARPPTDPSTCSVGAGGLWMPFHCDDPRVDRWSIETLDEIHPMAFQPKGGVEIVPAVVLMQNHEGPVVQDFLADNYEAGQGGESPLPFWSAEKRLDFQHLTIEMLGWQNSVFKLRVPAAEKLKKAGYDHAWLFRPPIVDAPKMLEAMLNEVKMDENTLDVKLDQEYVSLEEMVDDAKSMGCDALVNCTGMGSAKLCNDSKLVGARGILLEFDRHNVRRSKSKGEGIDARAVDLLHDACVMTEEAPWGSESHPFYMIPRGDKLVVGGTYLEGDSRTELQPDERARLLDNARVLSIDVNASPPTGEWTGFRPYRPTTRCEIDSEASTDNIKVVHSYGHGGSGWTVYVGAAREVATLLGYR